MAGEADEKLMLAALERDDAAEVERLLQQGFLPNLVIDKHRNLTAMHVAARAASDVILSKLMRHGGSTEALTKFKLTPLMELCRYNRNSEKGAERVRASFKVSDDTERFLNLPSL